MIRYFASHPTISNILMMAIVALGLASLSGLNKESFPQIKPSKVQVTVVYPGANPADVESGICNPLEDATDGISFLKEQQCDARDNVGIFTLEMQESGNMREFTDNIDTLRQIFRNVKINHPFKIEAIVILPEHLHTIWTLPLDDADYKTRWALIKAGFSRTIQSGERQSASRIKRGERGIWQRRYWEHLIRDNHDFEQHVDYIHWNPVKHGWVNQVKDWSYSSFHNYVEQGIYPLNWACVSDTTINGGGVMRFVR